MQRYLKKLGTNELRLYGYTPILAAKKEMIECNSDGDVLAARKEVTGDIDVGNAFDLGMSFRMTGEKTLKVWIEEHATEINAAGLEIQGLIIAKWRKHFNNEPMPDVCSFIVTADVGNTTPEIVDSINPGVDMTEE